MEEAKLESIIDSLNNKLDEDNRALIADDLTNLISENTITLSKIDAKDKEIQRLDTLRQKLVESNSNLFQQVGKQVKEPDLDESDNEEKKPFDYSSLFDENGNFK